MSDINVNKYYESYREAGFHFPTSILTTYAISLYTKPFLILSGISGTGKTKIAQLFNSSYKTQVSKKEEKPSTSLIIKIPKFLERFNFSQTDIDELFNEEEKQEFNRKVEEKRKENDDGNITDHFLFTIKDKYGEFQIGVYGQRASSPLIRGRFYKSKKDKKNKEYDSRIHIQNHYETGDVLQLKKIGEKKFEVFSVNDVEIKEIIYEYELENINRHCFIPVKSDWTDSSELFGFYNLVEKKYHVPNFLNFILTAMNNPEYPFFVTLDEMNLSKVEHYFSDILSCLESRFYQDGLIQQEKIILHNGLSVLETDCEEFEIIPNKIEIPLNLHITGTVNIDESTHMFSQKVLDRANVIEFNKVDLESYGSDKYEELDEIYKLKILPIYTQKVLPTKSSYENLSDDVKKHLLAINQILEKYNLHFGYRVANEIAQYILNALKYIDSNKKIEIMALDYQLVQKVFPKLNGGYAVLENPLREMLLYLSKNKDISEIKVEQTEFPITISKLLRMHYDLSVNGYSSFVM
jgi:hypothetical protein